MKCPFCRQTTTEIYNSRQTRFKSQVWRRRRCVSCQRVFTTYESADMSFIKVTNDGRSARYDRAKLFSSITGAFANPERSRKTVDAITDSVESKILDRMSEAISSSDIASIVLSTLKHFDGSAFLKYLGAHTELATQSQVSKELRKYR